MKKLFILIPVLIAALLISNSAYAAAWKLSRSVWTEQDEQAYSNFVERICDSKYGNLNKFIRDPKANPFYGEEDKKINLSPDCADLPYLIRAYVAYKLRLPFSYVSEISSKGGGDERYSKGNKPMQFKDQDYFSTPQQLFYQVTLVNSGYYRMDVNCETSDHYPIKINKKNLTPGTIYYDPDGHVALVAKVLDNGRIRLIDAHPDKSISKPWFGSKFSRGNKKNGGGFKKWRQIRYSSEGKTVRTQNHNLKDYSATDQYASSYSINGKSGLGYYDYIRLAMASSNSRSDPMQEFVFMMQDIFEDIRYRAIAVDVAIQKGCHLKPHPGKLPYNIYGTDGIWEELSTPSRDARLKVAFREFYDTTRQMVLNTERYDPKMARALAYNFLLKYDELSPKMCITYTNSVGRKIILDFADVNYRLFDLSFDPYHSIEYRWGAKGQELATANDGETKKKFYALERKLRNQLERLYGCNTPLTMGPERPVSVDIRGWLYSYIQGKSVDRNIIAFNKETIFDQPDTSEEESEDESAQKIPPEQTQIAMAVKQEQPVVNQQLLAKNPVSVPTSVSDINQTIENKAKIDSENESDMKPIEQNKENPQEKQQIVVAKVPDNSLAEIDNQPDKASDSAKQTEEPKVENKQPAIAETSSSNPAPDFWNSLLIKGDQIAATIGNSSNYSSSR